VQVVVSVRVAGWMLVCRGGRPVFLPPQVMILSTTSWYSRCLAAVVEIGEPLQGLVGGFEVFGFVDLVELLERVPGDFQSGMGRKEPIQVGLVSFAEVIGSA